MPCNGHQPTSPAPFPCYPADPGYAGDASALTGVRPTTIAGFTPDVRREVDALRAELARVSMQLAQAVTALNAHIAQGHQPVQPFPPGMSVIQPHWCDPANPNCAALPASHLVHALTGRRAFPPTGR